MIVELLEIRLLNFRQFYGKQTITFSNSEKNITIIFGENGKGKTGIFRALMFGLFGDKLLDQDDDRGPEIHFVNFKALNEKRNEIVNAKIAVRFKHNDEWYEIEREVDGILNSNGKIEERFSDPKLYIGKNNVLLANNPITDEIEINRQMNVVINEKIKKFFLFDGEKIDTLSTTTNRVREEVKEAIVTMMQIRSLENSIFTLRRIKNNETRRVNEKSNDYDIDTAFKKIEDLKKELASKQEILESKQDDLEYCLNEINDIRGKIESSQELEKNYENCKKVEEKIVTQKEELKEIQEQIRELLITKTSSLLMSDFYIIEKSYLESIIKEQKNNIPIELLELSLRSNKCVCCNNDLQQDHLARKYIENLKNNYKFNEMNSLINLLSCHIHDFTIDNQEVKNKIQQKMNIYSDKKQKLYNLKDQLASLKQDELFTISEYKNLQDLKNNLDKILKDKDELNRVIGSIDNEISQLNKQINEKEESLNNIIKSRDEYRKDYKVIKMLDNIEKHLSEIFKVYSNEMRNILSLETTTIFNNLIDEKDRNLVSAIEINEKYEIVIRNSFGLNITQDISQGQRRMVSISFITALAKVATGNKRRVDFPLFMDTPFGSFSGKNRDNLIINVPNLTSQWILLLTDTELTTNEEFTFKSTNKLGCWYELVQKEEYYTEIVKRDLNDQMSKRG